MPSTISSSATLLVVADFVDALDETSLGRAVVSLRQAAQWAAGFDVRLALEFRGKATFCSSLDTATALVEQCREPDYVGLDLKSRIAANNVCARRYQQLIATLGKDFVVAAGQKIVEDSERLAREKLRSIPDGTWSSRGSRAKDAGPAKRGTIVPSTGPMVVDIGELLCGESG